MDYLALNKSTNIVPYSNKSCDPGFNSNPRNMS